MHNSGHSAPPAVHAVFRRPTAGADRSADAEAQPGARRRFLRQRGTRTGFPTEPHHRNVTKIGKIIRQRLLPLRKSPSLAKMGEQSGKMEKAALIRLQQRAASRCGEIPACETPGRSCLRKQQTRAGIAKGDKKRGRKPSNSPCGAHRPACRNISGHARACCSPGHAKTHPARQSPDRICYWGMKM